MPFGRALADYFIHHPLAHFKLIPKWLPDFCQLSENKHNRRKVFFFFFSHSHYQVFHIPIIRWTCPLHPFHRKTFLRIIETCSTLAGVATCKLGTTVNRSWTVCGYATGLDKALSVSSRLLRATLTLSRKTSHAPLSMRADSTPSNGEPCEWGRKGQLDIRGCRQTESHVRVSSGPRGHLIWYGEGSCDLSVVQTAIPDVYI